MSQIRNTRAAESDMICASFSLILMATIVNKWPSNFPANDVLYKSSQQRASKRAIPVGREKICGCQTRMILSTPPVAIILAFSLYSTALTPRGTWAKRSSLQLNLIHPPKQWLNSCYSVFSTLNTLSTSSSINDLCEFAEHVTMQRRVGKYLI